MSMSAPKKGVLQPATPDKEPIGAIEVTDNPDYYRDHLGHTLEKPFWESVGNSFSQGWQSTPFKRFPKWLELRMLEEVNQGREKLDPATLNQMFPEVDEPFTSPTARAVAEEIAKRARERHILASIAERGPSHGVVGGAYWFTSWAAENAAAVLDPFTLGATIATGGLLAEAGIAFRGASFAAKAGNVALANFATAIPTEVVNTISARSQQETYNPISNLVAQTVVGTALHGAVHAAVHYGPRAFKFLRGSRGEALDLAEKTSIARVANDQAPAAEVITDRRFRGPALPPGESLTTLAGRDYRPIIGEAEARSRSFFHATPHQIGPFHETAKLPIGNDLGQGIYLTDNPHVANAIAANDYGLTPGRVHEVRLRGDAVETMAGGKPVQGERLELINLDKPLDPHFHETFRAPLEEAYGKDAANHLLEGTGREVVESVRDAMDMGRLDPTTLDRLNSDLQAAGFHGYRFRDGIGPEGAPHNVVMMFDHAASGDAAGKLEPIGEYLAHRDPNVGMTPEEFQQKVMELNDPVKSSVNYEEQSYKAMEAKNAKPLPELTTQKVHEQFEAIRQEMDELKKQGKLSKELAEHVDSEVRATQEHLANEETVTKAGMACLVGGM